MSQLPSGHQVQSNDEVYVCSSCGNFVEDIDDVTGWCLSCAPVILEPQLERYLRQHADELEYYLSRGNTLVQAVGRVNITNGSSCLICGSLMTRGRKPRVFCRKTKECRRMSRRYVYLYTERGMTKAGALAKIIKELT